MSFVIVWNKLLEAIIKLFDFLYAWNINLDYRVMIGFPWTQFEIILSSEHWFWHPFVNNGSYSSDGEVTHLSPFWFADSQNINT